MTTTSPPERLTAQIRTTVEAWHPRTHPVAVRVRLAGPGPALASCEIWTGDADLLWTHRADLPAGIGATMLDLERALIAAGYIYNLTHEARPAWRYDHNDAIHTLDFTRPW